MTKPHDELLACPFCGVVPVPTAEETGVDKYWAVMCENDDCLSPVTAKRSKADAIAAWNTRPAHPQAGEVVAWVREEARPKVLAEYVMLAFDHHPVRCGFWDGETWQVHGCYGESADTPSLVAPMPTAAHPQPHAEDDAELREGIARVIDPEAFVSTADEPRIVQVRAGTRIRDAEAKADSILKLISAARRDDQGGEAR